MAAINDIVAQIQYADLRQRIEAELKRVMKEYDKGRKMISDIFKKH